MALKDTWVDKVDGVDKNSAEDINAVAHAVIDVEEDLEWTTLAEINIDDSNAGVSAVSAELPNWRILETAKYMRLEIDVHAGDTAISSQAMGILFGDRNDAAYGFHLGYNTVEVEANKMGQYLAYYKFAENDLIYSGTQQRIFSGFCRDVNMYLGPNSVRPAQTISERIVPSWMQGTPPYFKVKLINGGLFGSGTMIKLEVC